MVWRILRQNPSRVLGCSELQEPPKKTFWCAIWCAKSRMRGNDTPGRIVTSFCTGVGLVVHDVIASANFYDSRIRGFGLVGGSNFGLHWLAQAHREGGVAGANAPGTRRAPSKNLSWCEKRWKRAGRNGEVKKCSSDTTCLPLPSGIQELPRAAGWLSKVADRTKIRRKQRKKDYFKGVFFLIISLYCIVILDFS